ncbi:MAG: Spy/CpxP family protein refolding chaperone [Acidobacteriota bacterium]|nr:Spy/CpxP family protein refolding chaperone [Acidobacteriota bacterium]
MFQTSSKTQTGRILARGVVVSVFALASILLVESAFGQFAGFRGGGGRGEGPGGKGRIGMRGAMMVEFLGLTEAQQADIKKIRKAARDQSKPIRKQLRTNRKALGEAVKAGDTTKIDTLATKQGKLQGQLVAIGANTRLDVKNVLTPEQQQKWTSFQEKLKARWEERRERRHQRRGGGPGGE